MCGLRVVVIRYGILLSARAGPATGCVGYILRAGYENKGLGLFSLNPLTHDPPPSFCIRMDSGKKYPNATILRQVIKNGKVVSVENQIPRGF